MPATGLAKPSVRIRTAIVAVDDPMEPGGPRLLARVNRDVDVLESELSHHRIGTAEYNAGRKLQRAFEAASSLSGSNWQGGSRVDNQQAQAHVIERAQRAVEAIAAASAIIGRSGVAFLEPILLRGYSLSGYAARSGARGSRADVTRVADRFRWLLEQLADGYGATGPDRSRIRVHHPPKED